MRSSIYEHYVWHLTIKTLRVCGAAGLIGFLLATAIDQIGANRAVLQALTTKISVPEVPVPTFDRRQDRADQSEQPAKADMLIGLGPARLSTHFITEAPVTNVEISGLAALDGPMWTADRPGKAASGLTVRAAGALGI
jgi:hypothetical protein